ncbi:P-loop containing nucleoside triphosphate hydrolase protein [Neolentinus lepideus HHB14362 ss-1]|uniref:p-loop containing nucleoside triphosphate hydrolase protein n=1 Tax=Neolentinus lepideus HHB14362 ss-1 TaxID=1314782 RepID=A0A165QS47_9AGAM|nr:P-loop containing nucleoside triphosphate hydrolase protein [Neolentinus lepideus HHB14362 ss-1]
MTRTGKELAFAVLAAALTSFAAPWAYQRSLTFLQHMKVSGRDGGSEDGSEDSDSDEVQPLSDKHYIQRDQIWSDESQEWLPFDPASVKRPSHPEEEDPQVYFYVNLRRESPHDKPTTVLSGFSDCLKHILRAVIGDGFFDVSPEYALKDFFPHLKILAKRLDSVDGKLIAKETLEDVLAFARSIGFDKKDTDGPIEFLNTILRHGEILLRYLEEEFKPTAERMALSLSFGQIEWSYLIYYFQPGEEYSTYDQDDPSKQIAFKLTSRSYEEGMFGPPYLAISGIAYEWDGWRYTTYHVRRRIEEYKGTMDLSGLTCKALTSELKDSLAERGKLYVSLAGVHYKTYLGERVMVDRRAYDDRDGYEADPDWVNPPFDLDLLHFLRPHVFGFNLVRKKWMPFAVELVAPVVFDENAWDHLVLDGNIKTLIKGLVDVTRNANSARKMVSDVISGKGGGLISVLHGPPGTGKTLTAEAVAEYLQRPLYMVGSSELSTEAEELEDNLRGILSLATAWDAVLLIDEADVFLEQRSLHELQRNALVSVALRVLEYHRGVLFLTTNRIQSFDEAFLSRFSLGIKYPELDSAARRAVWHKFFELAGAGSGISEADLDALSEKSFNGRTIKNLVRTSQALALSSNESLTVEHVNIVVQASQKFLDEFAQTQAQPKECLEK